MSEHHFNQSYWCDRCGRSFEETSANGLACIVVPIADNSRAIAARLREIQNERKPATPLADKLVDAALVCG